MWRVLDGVEALFTMSVLTHHDRLLAEHCAAVFIHSFLARAGSTCVCRGGEG